MAFARGVVDELLPAIAQFVDFRNFQMAQGKSSSRRVMAPELAGRAYKDLEAVCCVAGQRIGWTKVADGQLVFPFQSTANQSNRAASARAAAGPALLSSRRKEFL